MNNAIIKASAHYLPDEVITNEELSKIQFYNTKTGEKDFPITDEWIQKRSGIVERRRSAPNEYASDMAINVANKLLEKTNTDPKSLDGIIVSTVSQDHGFPSTAHIVMDAINAEAKEVYDIGNACPGFLTAMNAARQYIMTGELEKVMVIATETLTKAVDYEDCNSMLFGDGAGGVIMEPCNNAEGFLASTSNNITKDGCLYHIHYGHLTKDDPIGNKIKKGSGFQGGNLRMPGGREVYKIVTEYVPKDLKYMMELVGWVPEDITTILLHQANYKMNLGAIEKFAKMLDDDSIKEKFFHNIQTYGNMSGVTSAIALSEQMENGAIKKGSKVLMHSAGSGMNTRCMAHQF